ncbi:MAG: hypothetical protein ACR2OI_12980 [Acidimicrobiia bacterium]
MSTEARVMALLEEGNPASEAPEAAWSEFDASTYLAGLEQRSKRVVQLETKPRETRKTRPAIGWVLAAGALIVVGAIILTTNDRNDLPPADQPTTTTAVPTTTTTTTSTTTSTSVPLARDLATAETMMAALYEPGGASLAALPWADPTVPKAVNWISEFGSFANAEILDASCVAGQNTVTCRSTSQDDVSRAVDESAVYSDEFTLAFNGPTGLIINATWRMTMTGRLDEFFSWTENSAPHLYNRGGACNIDADQPTGCATALLGLVPDFEESAGS